MSVHVYVVFACCGGQALLWIEELEQLIRTVKSRPPHGHQQDTDNGGQSAQSDELLPFRADDIDAICTLCYNWAVTLVELSQHDLAEKFACKALSLAALASPQVRSLKETIQVPCVRADAAGGVIARR